MLKKIAMIYGTLLIVIGLLGFIPGITSLDTDSRQLLLGIFLTDAWHNTLFLIAGIATLIAAGNTHYSRRCLVAVGVLFGLIAFVGFFDATVFGLVRVNMAANWLHLILALGMLGTGLGIHGHTTHASTPAKTA